MAKKHTPAWQLMGLDGPPPVSTGMHEYGRVWSVEDGPQREPLRYVLAMGWLSHKMWGRKIRKQIVWALTTRRSEARG